MIIYYTHNAKPRGFLERCYNYHREQAQRVGQEFKAVVAEPIGPGDEVFSFDPNFPKYADIYQRILHGITCVPDDEPVFLVEDDTLYPDDRYSRELPCPWTVIYNLNLCYIGPLGYAWHMRGGIALSQMMGSASAVRHNVGLKLDATLKGEMACVEPCSGQERDYRSGTCSLGWPSVDFRTDYNATWKLPEDIEYFEDLLGWPSASELWRKLYKGEEV